MNTFIRHKRQTLNMIKMKKKRNKSAREVILKEGRVAALSHTYAVKSLLVTMARPKFALKSTPSRGLIPKPHYLPHSASSLDPSDAKRHSDPIRRFPQCTGQTDARTDAQTDRSSTSL